MQNLWLNLFWMPHAAPHRCCFCLKPCKKTLSSKDSGPASLPSCCLLLAPIWIINFPPAVFSPTLAEIHRILEFTRLSSGFGESCNEPRRFDGECTLNIWGATKYAISNCWKSSWHEGCNLQLLFPSVRIATSSKQQSRELFCVNTVSMQNLWLNLFWMPHAAPHRCCFCLKPCKKTLSSKYSGPASLPSCCLLLAPIWTSILHQQCFRPPWLKFLES